MKRREPFPNRQVIDLTDVRLISLGCPRLFIARIPRFRRKQIINELPEIAFVITKSMRADVAFVAQMVEEWSTKLIEHCSEGAGFKFRTIEIGSDVLKVRATLHPIAGFDYKSLARTHARVWARLYAHGNNVVVTVPLVRGWVVAQNILLRHVRGDLRKGIIKILHRPGNVSRAASLGSKLLHASLGCEGSHIGIVIESGLHDINLTIVGERALHRGVKIRAAGRVLAVRNDHNDPPTRVWLQVRAALDDGVEQRCGTLRLAETCNRRFQPPRVVGQWFSKRHVSRNRENSRLVDRPQHIAKEANGGALFKLSEFA